MSIRIKTRTGAKVVSFYDTMRAPDMDGYDNKRKRNSFPPVVNRKLRNVHSDRSMSLAETAILEQLLIMKARMSRRRGSYPKNKVRVHPRVRFRRYIRLTLICIRLCNSSYQSVKASGDEFLSILQVSDDYTTIDRDGLFFDRNDFKANKEDRLPQEARRILQMKPAERSNKDIQYLMVILGNIPAFAEYPIRMQHKLCAVGWFEAYEPKRAIIREGHPPHSFYFILSGTVLVTALEHGSARTLVSLQTGMSFGELAVITRSRRQATVSTHTHSELLCISAKDFEDIFMAGGMQNLNDPDHNSFISRGQVLVRDSNNSDWIYIVKSGSLSVLKKLRATHADIKRPSKDSDGVDHLSRSFGSMDLRLRKRRRKHPQRMSYSEPEVYKSQYEMERRLEQTLPGFHNTQDRLGLIDYESIIGEHRSRLIQKPSESTLLPKIESSQRQILSREGERTTEKPFHLPPINNRHDNSEDAGNRLGPEIRPVSKTAKGVYLAPSPLRRHPNPDDVTADVLEEQKNLAREARVNEELARMQIEYRRKIMEREGRKTIAEELDSKGRRDFVFTEADLNPMFILVQVLERGQYFGVSNMMYPEQPSLSLVSNGAECIVLSKKFFLEKATEASLRHLRISECPFPNDGELQKNLQDYVNWEAHRAKIYRRLVKQKHKLHVKKKQFIPQYMGQYSFRTGPI